MEVADVRIAVMYVITFGSQTKMRVGACQGDRVDQHLEASKSKPRTNKQRTRLECSDSWRDEDLLASEKREQIIDQLRLT